MCSFLEFNQVLRLFFKSIVIFVISLFLLIMIVLFFSLQSTPFKTPQYNVNAQAAKNAEQLLQRVKYAIKHSSSLSTITIEKKDLHSLSAIINRSYSLLVIDSTIEPINSTENDVNSSFKFVVKSSIHLPIPFYKPYLNVTVELLSSKVGLNIDKVMIGSLTFSGDLVLSVAEFIINNLQSELGSAVISIIKSVDIKDKQLTLQYQLPENFDLFTNNSKGRLLALRDDLALFGDVEKIRFYYQKLLRFVHQNEEKNTKLVKNTKSLYSTNLVDYVGYMLVQANKQTVSDNQLQAAVENESALLALAIYFGSSKFELIVGEVSNLSAHKQQIREKLISTVSVLNRQDLQQHFIYSMALQLFSSYQLSNTLGELKELLDSNSGGSGFSFADLMADRAGNRLALLATASEKSALKAQAYFSHQENYEGALPLKLLPSILNLPEGLDQKSFEQSYQNVNSVQYKEMIDIIDKRLATIELYQ